MDNFKKYICDICGYIYDEAKGDPDLDIPAGTKWEDIPADFTCPFCGASKDNFSVEK
ncbi:MAG: rubredoxin [Clostridia bacterium]